MSLLIELDAHKRKRVWSLLALAMDSGNDETFRGVKRMKYTFHQVVHFDLSFAHTLDVYSQRTKI